MILCWIVEGFFWFLGIDTTLVRNIGLVAASTVIGTYIYWCIKFRARKRLAIKILKYIDEQLEYASEIPLLGLCDIINRINISYSNTFKNDNIKLLKEFYEIHYGEPVGFLALYWWETPPNVTARNSSNKGIRKQWYASHIEFLTAMKEYYSLW